VKRRMDGPRHAIIGRSSPRADVDVVVQAPQLSVRSATGRDVVSSSLTDAILPWRF